LNKGLVFGARKLLHQVQLLLLDENQARRKFNRPKDPGLLCQPLAKRSVMEGKQTLGAKGENTNLLSLQTSKYSF